MQSTVKELHCSSKSLQAQLERLFGTWDLLQKYEEVIRFALYLTDQPSKFLHLICSSADPEKGAQGCIERLEFFLREAESLSHCQLAGLAGIKNIQWHKSKRSDEAVIVFPQPSDGASLLEESLVASQAQPMKVKVAYLQMSSTHEPTLRFLQQVKKNREATLCFLWSGRQYKYKDPQEGTLHVRKWECRITEQATNQMARRCEKRAPCIDANIEAPDMHIIIQTDDSQSLRNLFDILSDISKCSSDWPGVRAELESEKHEHTIAFLLEMLKFGNVIISYVFSEGGTLKITESESESTGSERHHDQYPPSQNVDIQLTYDRQLSKVLTIMRIVLKLGVSGTPDSEENPPTRKMNIRVMSLLHQRTLSFLQEMLKYDDVIISSVWSHNWTMETEKHQTTQSSRLQSRELNNHAEITCTPCLYAALTARGNAELLPQVRLLQELSSRQEVHVTALDVESVKLPEAESGTSAPVKPDQVKEEGRQLADFFLNIRLCDRITHVRMRDCAVPPGVWSRVAKQLQGCYQIQSLDLSQTRGVPAKLGHAIATMTSLREVSMRGCKMTRDVSRDVLSGLRQCERLLRLNLQENSLADGVSGFFNGPRQASNFGETLDQPGQSTQRAEPSSPQVQALLDPDMPPLVSEARTFSRPKKKTRTPSGKVVFPSLQVLDLFSTGLTQKDLQSLCEATQSRCLPELKKLDLGKNHLSSRVQDFLGAASSFPFLEELSLRSADLIARDLSGLSDALKGGRLPRLCVLRVSPTGPESDKQQRALRESCRQRDCKLQMC